MQTFLIQITGKASVYEDSQIAQLPQAYSQFYEMIPEMCKSVNDVGYFVQHRHLGVPDVYERWSGGGYHPVECLLPASAV